MQAFSKKNMVKHSLELMDFQTQEAHGKSLEGKWKWNYTYVHYS